MLNSPVLLFQANIVHKYAFHTQNSNSTFIFLVTICAKAPSSVRSPGSSVG